MAQTNSRGAAGRKTPARPAAVEASPAPADEAVPPAAGPREPEAPPPAMDTLDAWTARATREGVAFEIAACRAVLRATKAWREAQWQSAERTESNYLRAADRLLEARGLEDFASIQADLLRNDGEQLAQYWSELTDLATRNSLSTVQELTDAWLRANTALWEGFTQWSQLQSKLGGDADLVEAEVEHVTNAWSANPWVWPAQEAARQSMTVAGSAWNEWLSWPNRLMAMASPVGTRAI